EREYSHALAKCHHDLGMVYRRTDRLPEAETETRRALEVRQAALRDDPTPTLARRNQLADSQVNLALILGQTKRFAESEMGHAAAEQTLTALRKDDPTSLDVTGALGALYINWGLLAEDEKQPEAALTRYGQAIALLEPAHRREPQFARVNI